MKITNEWLEQLCGEVVSDITTSLEFTQNNLKMKQRWLRKTIRSYKSYKKSKWSRKGSFRPWGYYQVNWARRQVKKKQPSHWRYCGIVETNNDFWENCEEQFQKLIKEKLEIEKNNEIDRCHRETNDFKKFK